MRIGFGYDVHEFAEGRQLILGGVAVPYDKGLLGHSDADVLLHAVMDALLGAAGLGDIGRHFPDTDPNYENIESTILLKETIRILADKGYICHNLDCTIAAQAPKLKEYLDDMKENIAEILKVDGSLINIKATTTEGLGFVGRKEGMAAYAVCTIMSKETCL